MCAAATAALVAAGCGEDDKKPDKSANAAPTAVVLELTGTKKDPKMSAPASVKAGPAQISFKNSSQGADGAQIVRVEGNHSAEETLKAGNPWGDKGKPLPDWITLAGGVGDADPGETKTATQSLKPGNYYVIGLEGNATAPMKVTGTESGPAPSSAQKIDAVEYKFTASGLKAGKQQVLFENKGKQPHFIVGGPLKKGTTLEDAKKSFQKESGPPPIDEKSSFNTAILEGGTSQVANLDLKKGKYVFVCFIPDRQGGPPHVAKGMVSGGEVK
jgi:hypothetical protein